MRTDESGKRDKIAVFYDTFNEQKGSKRLEYGFRSV